MTNLLAIVWLTFLACPQAGETCDPSERVPLTVRAADVSGFLYVGPGAYDLCLPSSCAVRVEWAGTPKQLRAYIATGHVPRAAVAGLDPIEVVGIGKTTRRRRIFP